MTSLDGGLAEAERVLEGLVAKLEGGGVGRDVEDDFLSAWTILRRTRNDLNDVGLGAIPIEGSGRVGGEGGVEVAERVSREAQRVAGRCRAALDSISAHVGRPGSLGSLEEVGFPALEAAKREEVMGNLILEEKEAGVEGLGGEEKGLRDGGDKDEDDVASVASSLSDAMRDATFHDRTVSNRVDDDIFEAMEKEALAQIQKRKEEGLGE